MAQYLICADAVAEAVAETRRTKRDCDLGTAGKHKATGSWRVHEVARYAPGNAVSVVRFARRLSVRQLGPLDGPSRTYESHRQAGDSRRPWCPDEQTALGADGALFGIGPIGPIRGFSKRAVGQCRRRAI